MQVTRFSWRLWLALMLLPCLQIESEPNRLLRLSGVSYHAPATFSQSYHLLRFYSLQASAVGLTEPQTGISPPYALPVTAWRSVAIAQNQQITVDVEFSLVRSQSAVFAARAPPSVVG